MWGRLNALPSARMILAAMVAGRAGLPVDTAAATLIQILGGTLIGRKEKKTLRAEGFIKVQ